MQSLRNPGIFSLGSQKVKLKLFINIKIVRFEKIVRGKNLLFFYNNINIFLINFHDHF